MSASTNVVLLSANPAAVPKSTTTNVTVYAQNTTWTVTPPTFTFSGVSGTSLGSITVVNDTTAIVPVNAGSTAGLGTLTDTLDTDYSGSNHPTIAVTVGYAFNLPTFQSSNTAYVGYLAQTAFDTAMAENAGGSVPTVRYLRFDKAASSFRWLRNLAMIRTGQGDAVGDSDEEQINPRGAIVLDLPWTPTTHLALLKLCGVDMSGGSAQNGQYYGVSTPGNVTFFHGLGTVSTDVYFNAQFTGGTITASRTSPSARLRLNFTAGQQALNSVGYGYTLINGTGPDNYFPGLILPYEKPFHFSNIVTATLIGGTLFAPGGASASQGAANAYGPAKLESITINITPTNTPLFMARPDGKDLISDFRFDDMSGSIQFTRAFNSNAERKAYIAACDGQDGQMFVTFAAGGNCTADGYNHSISVGCFGRYTTDDLTHPDKQSLMEALTLQGRRNSSNNSGAGGTVWQSGLTTSPLGFSFGIASGVSYPSY